MVANTQMVTLEETIVMPEVRTLFYERTLEKWLTNKTASILVVGGGERDKEVLMKLGFKNVTISNLDSRLTGNEFSPYQHYIIVNRPMPPCLRCIESPKLELWLSSPVTVF
jgi:hypothetical protein